LSKGNTDKKHLAKLIREAKDLAKLAVAEILS